MQGGTQQGYFIKVLCAPLFQCGRANICLPSKCTFRLPLKDHLCPWKSQTLSPAAIQNDIRTLNP